MTTTCCLRGELVAAETTAAGSRGRYVLERVRLRDSTGLTVTGRLLRPTASGARLPAILLDDGRELNSKAIDYLPPEFGDVVVLSVDYPEAIPYVVGVKDLFVNGGRVRKAARLIPASFSLAGTGCLCGRCGCDARRCRRDVLRGTVRDDRRRNRCAVP